MKTAKFLCTMFVTIGFATSLPSVFAQPNADFAKANENYAAGQFQEAINGYEKLVRAREWSANLFYDLGNAYFRMKDFGHAILNYERALALDRFHPEADANLRIVRDEARALEMQPSWPERYFKRVSVNQYSIAAAIVFWLGTFSVFGLIFGRRRSAGMITLSILAFSIFLTTVFAIYKLDNGSNGRFLAIVTSADVEARFATADNVNSVLALPAGSQIKILSTRGDWVYAALPNNLRGWLPAKSAELVRL
jgi:tetratricopeptide (TPR) repeat protein